MEIVHVTDVHQPAPEDRKLCEATKAWFKVAYGRASRRAMTDGALSRGQKELIASIVSARNVCEH
jgi:hypothetical protein